MKSQIHDTSNKIKVSGSSTQDNNAPRSRIIIITLALAIILVASILCILFLRFNSKNNTIAIIYVDSTEYMRIDLSSSDDTVFQVVSSNGATNTIEIKNHDIRMLSAECPNNLCVKQGWHEASPLPIVCLPNNIVITVIDNTNNIINTYNSDKEGTLDAITY